MGRGRGKEEDEEGRGGRRKIRNGRRREGGRGRRVKNEYVSEGGGKGSKSRFTPPNPVYSPPVLRNYIRTTPRARAPDTELRVLLQEPPGAALGLINQQVICSSFLAPRADHQTLVPASSRIGIRKKVAVARAPQEQFLALAIRGLNVQFCLHPSPVTKMKFLIRSESV